MRAKVFTRLKWTAILVTVAALTFFAIRIYDVQRGPSLEIWHTYVPGELDAEKIDKTDWDEYLAKENRIFEELRLEVSQKLKPMNVFPSIGILRGVRSIRGTFHRPAFGRALAATDKDAGVALSQNGASTILPLTSGPVDDPSDLPP